MQLVFQILVQLLLLQNIQTTYGKIKSSQAKYVKAKGYKIIMWDVLSADFDQNITKESV
jgi:hypothetical protein